MNEVSAMNLWEMPTQRQVACPESSPENEKSEIQKSTVALFFTVFYEPAAAGGRTAASATALA